VLVGFLLDEVGLTDAFGAKWMESSTMHEPEVRISDEWGKLVDST
jgi:hypothetical protein